MKSGQTEAASLLPHVVDLLEAKTALGGLTPGQLRAGLARKCGTSCGLSEVRALCHELWRRREVVIEPPAAGKREYRVWHARHRKDPNRPAQAPPARRTREEFDGGESNFRATMCGQLVAEWKAAEGKETKETLRRLLANFGAERWGTPGEVVPFKGRRHECEGRVVPGDPVRVVEDGWVLRQGSGEYLLAKALVKPV